jgi:hypothetical protein
MTEPDIGSFLNEFKASLTETGSDAILRRIDAERMIKLIADELVESRKAERIRILADSRLSGQRGSDFLLQVDDYDLRLELLDAPDERPTLDMDRLPILRKLLEDNPSTVALVLTWMTDELLSLPLSLTRIAHLQKYPAELAGLLNRARPLDEVLQHLIERHERIWSVEIETGKETEQGIGHYPEQFEASYLQAVAAECARAYRARARREAAESFPLESEKQRMMSAFEDAMRGAEAQALKQMILSVSRRGAR